MMSNLRILVVDDARRMTTTLADILTAQGYEIAQASSGPEALQLAQAGAFDCVVTDVKMPGMNGVELFRELHQKQPGLPVVFMTAYAADDLLRSGLEEGVIGVLNKPLDLHQLLGFLTLLGKQNRVTVVDDDPRFCETLAEILQLRGFKVSQITNPDAEVDQMAACSQAILLDLRLNAVNGLDVFREIRRISPDLPVFFITGYREEMSKLVAETAELGAVPCLWKPLEIPNLLKILVEVQLSYLRPWLNAH